MLNQEMMELLLESPMAKVYDKFAYAKYMLYEEYVLSRISELNSYKDIDEEYYAEIVKLMAQLKQL